MRNYGRLPDLGAALKLIEKFAAFRLFGLLPAKLLTDGLQYHPADEAVDGFAVPLCAFGNELAAACGEGHIDAIIVGGGIFIVGADFCITVLFLGHGIHLTDIIT